MDGAKVAIKNNAKSVKTLTVDIIILEEGKATGCFHCAKFPSTNWMEAAWDILYNANGVVGDVSLLSDRLITADCNRIYTLRRNFSNPAEFLAHDTR